MKDKIKNIAEKLEHQIRMHELDLNDRIKDIPHKPKGRFFWLPLAKYIKRPILLQTKNRPFDFIFCYI